MARLALTRMRFHDLLGGYRFGVEGDAGSHGIDISTKQNLSLR